MNQAALAASLRLAARQGWGALKTKQHPQNAALHLTQGHWRAGKDLLQWGINVGSAIGVGT